ncbi:hypothetical protein MRX96_038389 [Rhipicephalus microplus]
MLPLLQHDDAVDCVPLVYPATPLEVDPSKLHGFSDGPPRVPSMTDVIYSEPFIANTWSATSTRDAIKAIAAAPRIGDQNSVNTGMSLNRCLIFTQLFGFYHGLLSGDGALSSMLPLLQHDDAVDCVPLVYPATPLEVDPGTLHGFSDGLPRVPPMTDVISSESFIYNTWSATSTRDAIKTIAAAPSISGQNSGNTGM